MKKLIFAAAMLAIGIGVSQAHTLTPSQALARVRNEKNIPMQSIQSMGVTQDQKLLYTLTHDDVTTVYVFQNASGGYMVVSADDITPRGLLGYSDDGSLDSTSLPENIDWWFSTYSEQISHAVQNANKITTGGTSGYSTDAVQSPMASTKIYRKPVAPIVQTRWNQVAPFNLLCPTINGKHCPVGCVATAMAQAMTAYRWPDVGTSSHSYTPAHIDSMLTVNYAETTFDWDIMKDFYPSTETDSSAMEVAKLSYACGVAVNMNYMASSSGASFSSAAQALIKYFRYKNSLTCLTRDYYDLDTWTNMIYDEIAQGYPVLYGGQNNEAGHAFVCDGYSEDDYFHINWGWGGTSNGYFLLTALDPAEQGVGGSSSGYNMSQQIILGIRPDTDGEDSSIVPIFDLQSDFETSTSAISRLSSSTTVRFKDTRGIFNNSVGTVTVHLGVKLVDESGEVSYLEVAKQQTFVANQGMVSYSIPASSFPQSGTYVVSPAVKTIDGQWYDMHVKMSNIGTLNLTATPNTLVFKPGEEATIQVENLQMATPLFSGKDVMVKATMVNTSGEEYYQDIVPVLVKDDAEVSQQDAVAVDVLAGESEDVAWVGKFSGTLSAGDYELYLVDGNGKTIGGPTMVTLEDAPTETPAATATTVIGNQSGRGASSGDPVEISLSEFIASADIDCTAGYFAHQIEGMVYYSASKRATTLPGEFIGITADQTAHVEFAADLSTLESSPSYMFVPYAVGYGQLGMPTYFTALSMSSVTDVTTPVTIGMWPNPATDAVRIDAAAGVKNVEIYSINGYQALSQKADGSMAATIDVSSFAPGLYVVRVLDGDGTTHTLKLIKR